MYQTLLIVLVLDCFALMVVVLLQAGKGGGLAAGFGGAGTGIEMMGSRQTATFLHNATRWLGGAFLVVCFALSLMTVRATGPRGLIEREMEDQVPPPEAASAPGAPGDLQDVLGGTPAGEANGSPETPAGGSPTTGSEPETPARQ